MELSNKFESYMKIRHASRAITVEDSLSTRVITIDHPCNLTKLLDEFTIWINSSDELLHVCASDYLLDLKIYKFVANIVTVHIQGHMQDEVIWGRLYLSNTENTYHSTRQRTTDGFDDIRERLRFLVYTMIAPSSSYPVDFVAKVVSGDKKWI